MSESLDGVERDEPEPQNAFREGQILAGRYLVGSLISRGGMGEVYEGRHLELGKQVAIKTLRGEHESEGSHRRFEREARTLAKLQNEHIVSVFDFGRCEDSRTFLVMEYLVGPSLRSLLRAEGALVASRAVRLVMQICQGLAAAHAVGAVHRDMKPENVIVCRSGDGAEVCKILDFGLVKLREVDGLGMRTRTGVALGTLSYMSPEQARGDLAVDHRSDLYSTAAILYELLSGKRPHEADSAPALLYKIVHERPKALNLLCDVPPALSKIVQRGLAPTPDDRYPSAAAFSAVLQPFRSRGSVLESQATTRSTSTSSLAGANRPHRRRGAIALSAAVGIGAIALVTLPTRPTPSSGRPLVPGTRPEARPAQAEAAPSSGQLSVAVPSPIAPEAGVPRGIAVLPAMKPVAKPQVVKPSAAIVPSAKPAGTALEGLEDNLPFDRNNPYDAPH